MNTLGQRIAHYRQLKNMSQAQLAEACGWSSQSRVGNYEKDIREPNLDNLSLIAEKLGIDRMLLIDKQPLYIKNTTEEKPCIINAYSYPIVSWTSASIYQDTHEKKHKGDFVNTDIYAGTHGFWLKVKGNSMTANSGISFPAGMYILVNPDAQLENGSFTITKTTKTNDVIFRQYIEEAGVKYLKALNQSYKMQELDDQWQIVGKIVDARWRL